MPPFHRKVSARQEGTLSSCSPRQKRRKAMLHFRQHSLCRAQQSTEHTHPVLTLQFIFSEKQRSTQKGPPTQPTVRFSAETTTRRSRWNHILKEPKALPTMNFVPAENIPQERGEIKTFSDKGKPREFVFKSRFVLKAWLQAVLSLRISKSKGKHGDKENKLAFL